MFAPSICFSAGTGTSKMLLMYSASAQHESSLRVKLADKLLDSATLCTALGHELYLGSEQKCDCGYCVGYFSVEIHAVMPGGVHVALPFLFEAVPIWKQLKAVTWTFVAG